MSGAHSILPPSGAAAWRRCAMWPTMNRLFPQPDTPETLEGTAAHFVFAEMLEGRQVAAGAMAPNGVIVTDEMVDGAELMVDTCRETFAGREVSMYVEQRVDIQHVHPDCFGTPDVWAYDGSTLDVVDYKFGHRFVDEFENDQCVAYAAGILDLLASGMGKGVGELDQITRIRVTVVQPRCYYRGAPVRRWTVRASDLRAQINILSGAAHAAMQPNPAATTNSECFDCPGRHACDAYQKAVYHDAEVSTRSTPVVLEPAAASLELKMLERSLERLQGRVEGLREQVAAYARAGHKLPWHRVEQGYARQQWTIPAEQVLAIGSMMNVNLSKPAVLTPKQAQKAGVDEAVIKAYSHTPMGSVKLIPENPADVRRVFGNPQGVN